MNGIKITESPLLKPRFHVLKRNGVAVWMGPLGAPIEDADFDEVVMHPDDAARVRKELEKQV